MAGGGGGSSSATIGPEGGTITSRDGKLTLTFPPDALSEDTEVTIREIDPDDLPPEFDGVDADSAYQLEPDGLEFAVPVTATLMLDEDPVQDDGGLQTEAVLLLTSSDGELEVLENLSQEVDGDAEMTTVSGELGHFSPLVDSHLGITILVSGVPDSLPVKDTFDALVEVVKPDFLDEIRIVPDPGTNEYTDLSVSPIIGLTVPFGESKELPFIVNNNAQILEGLFTYICDFVGTGKYVGEVDIRGRRQVAGLVTIFTFTFTMGKKVECVGAGPTPSPQPSPGPTPTPTPEPESCVIPGVYQSSAAGCGISNFNLSLSLVGGSLLLMSFGENAGVLTFNPTVENPEKFQSVSSNIIIFGEPGHSCMITCGPGQNQLTLMCTRPGAMCTEVFTLQQ